ncbi:unnamed protein product [Closterium sp. Naga37s-1]|nr:unnamed protein product [Closterium sp. Naga37s-1]
MSGNGDNSGGAILELGDYNDQVPPSPFPEPIKEEEASVEGRNVPMPDVTLEEELSESLMPLKWVFFPEADPVQQFRGKPWREKIWVFLKGVFPILAWLPEYDWRYYLLGDIIGGVSIAIMSVPQDVSYAKYANMPAEFALRTSFIPPLLYAIQGSSKHLVIAPVSVISQLLGTSVSALANPATDPALYTSLVVTATFFCGLFQLIMGMCRFGFLVDFLNQPTIVGFLSGCSLTIAIQQLKLILGYKDFTLSTSIVNIIAAIVQYSYQFQWKAFVMGTSFFLYLSTVRLLVYLKPKNKVFYYLNALGPLTSIVVSTIIVAVAGLADKGIPTIGKISTGLHGASSISYLNFSKDNVADVAAVGFITCLVSLAESVGIARTFASLYGYHLDGNKEMVAFGSMNLVGSFTSCYVAAGSFSRTAVNMLAGAKTALTQVIMALLILLVLLVAAPLFKNVPNVRDLTGIVSEGAPLPPSSSCSASCSSVSFPPCSTARLPCSVGDVEGGQDGLPGHAQLLIPSLPASFSPPSQQLDFHAAWALWRVDKMDFLVMSGCFLAILFGSPEIGLLVAILLSIIKILLRSLRPHIRLLGLLPNAAATAVSVLQFPNSALCEGIVMLRVESPLYFPGANFVRQRVKKLCDAYARGYQQPVKVSNCSKEPLLVLQFPNSALCEGIVMLRVESPLYFPGANFVRQRVKKLCDAYARGYQQPVKVSNCSKEPLLVLQFPNSALCEGIVMLRVESPLYFPGANFVRQRVKKLCDAYARGYQQPVKVSNCSKEPLLVLQFPNSALCEGIVMLRVESPLYFPGANFVRQRVKKLCDAYARGYQQPVKVSNCSKEPLLVLQFPNSALCEGIVMLRVESPLYFPGANFVRQRVKKLCDAYARGYQQPVKVSNCSKEPLLVLQFPNSALCEGIVMLRVESPLYFPGANFVRQRVKKLCDAYARGYQQPVKVSNCSKEPLLVLQFPNSALCEGIVMLRVESPLYFPGANFVRQRVKKLCDAYARGYQQPVKVSNCSKEPLLVLQFPNSALCEGIVMLRVESPLYFPGANFVRQRVKKLCDAYARGYQQPVKVSNCSKEPLLVLQFPNSALCEGIVMLRVESPLYFPGANFVRQRVKKLCDAYARGYQQPVKVSNCSKEPLLVLQFPNSALCEGIVMLRVESPLYFPGANFVRQRVKKLCDAYARGYQQPVKVSNCSKEPLLVLQFPNSALCEGIVMLRVESPLYFPGANFVRQRVKKLCDAYARGYQQPVKVSNCSKEPLLVLQFPNSALCEGIVMLRVESPLYFPGANFVRQRVKKLCDAYARGYQQPVKVSNCSKEPLLVLQFPNSALCEGIVMLRVESPLYFPGANFVRQRVKKLCDAYARGYQQPVKVSNCSKEPLLVLQFPNSALCEGIVMLRVESPLYFPGANFVRQRVKKLCDAYARGYQQPVKVSNCSKEPLLVLQFPNSALCEGIVMLRVESPLYFPGANFVRQRVKKLCDAYARGYQQPVKVSNCSKEPLLVLQFPNSALCEGIVMLRVESPLYFPGANFVRQRVKKLCDAYARGYQQPVKVSNCSKEPLLVLQFPNSALCEGIVMLRVESPLYFPGANFVRQRVKKLCDAYARGYQQPVKVSNCSKEPLLVLQFPNSALCEGIVMLRVESPLYFPGANFVRQRVKKLCDAYARGYQQPVKVSNCSKEPLLVLQFPNSALCEGIVMLRVESPLYFPGANFVRQRVKKLCDAYARGYQQPVKVSNCSKEPLLVLQFPNSALCEGIVMLRVESPLYFPGANFVRQRVKKLCDAYARGYQQPVKVSNCSKEPLLVLQFPNSALCEGIVMLRVESPLYFPGANFVRQRVKKLCDAYARGYQQPVKVSNCSKEPLLVLQFPNSALCEGIVMLRVESPLYFPGANFVRQRVKKLCDAYARGYQQPVKVSNCSKEPLLVLQFPNSALCEGIVMLRVESPLYFPGANFVRQRVKKLCDAYARGYQQPVKVSNCSKEPLLVLQFPNSALCEGIVMLRVESPLYFPGANFVRQRVKKLCDAYARGYQQPVKVSNCSKEPLLVLQFPNSALCEGIVMLRVESPLYFPGANFVRQRVKKLCDAYARGYQQPVKVSNCSKEPLLVLQFPNSALCEGIVMLRVESPLYFPGANFVRQRVKKLCDAYARGYQQPVKRVKKLCDAYARGYQQPVKVSNCSKEPLLVLQFPNSALCEGIVMLRVESPLYFPGANFVRQRVKKLCDAYARGYQQPVKVSNCSKEPLLVLQFPNSALCEGIVMLRVESPLYFPGANFVRQRVKKLCDAYARGYQQPVKVSNCSKEPLLVLQFPNSALCEGIVMLRVESPLYFPGANFVRQRVKKLCDAYARGYQQPVKVSNCSKEPLLVLQFPNSALCEGIVMLRVESPLYFPGANFVRQRVKKLCDAYARGYQQPVKVSNCSKEPLLVLQFPNSALCEGIVMLRVESPLYFPGANFVRQRVKKLCDAYARGYQQPVKVSNCSKEPLLVLQFPNSALCEGIVMLRVESPLYFPGANFVRQRVKKLCDAYARGYQQPVKVSNCSKEPLLVLQFPNSALCEGIVMLRVESPLYFPGANFVRQRVKKLCDAYARGYQQPVKVSNCSKEPLLVLQFPNSALCEGIVMLRVESPLYFPGANFVRQRVKKLCDAYARGYQQPVKVSNCSKEPLLVLQFPNSALCEGIVMLRVESPLYFPGANFVRQRVKKLCDAYARGYQQPVKVSNCSKEPLLVLQFPNSALCEGIVMLRVESPLYFPGANFVRQRVKKLCDAYARGYQQPVKVSNCSKEPLLVLQFPNSALCEGIVMLRVESPLYFPGANFVRQRVKKLCDAYARGYQQPVKVRNCSKEPLLVLQFPNSALCEGIVMLRVESPLYFPGANFVRQRVKKLCDAYARGYQQPVKVSNCSKEPLLVLQFPNSALCEGIVMLRVESPLYFPGANFVRQRVKKLCDAYARGYQQPVKVSNCSKEPLLVLQFPNSALCEGIVMLRVESPLYFPGANFVRQRVKKLCDAYARGYQQPVKVSNCSKEPLLVLQFPNSALCEGIVMLRVESPLYFPGANFVRQRVKKLCDAYARGYQQPVKVSNCSKEPLLVLQFPNSALCEGIVMLRVESPLYFPGANFVRQRVKKLCDAYARGYQQPVKVSNCSKEPLLVLQFPNSALCEGIVMLRVESPLYFPGANFVRQRVKKLCDAYARGYQQPVKVSNCSKEPLLVLQFPNSALCEGIVMLRVESPLYFPGANFVRQRVKKLCDAYARGYQQPVKVSNCSKEPLLVLQFPNSALCEGIVMLRVESPLYFPGANFVRQRVKKLCDAYARGYQQPVKVSNCSKEPLLVLQFPNSALCEGIVMLRVESPLYFPGANFVRQRVKKLCDAYARGYQQPVKVSNCSKEPLLVLQFPNSALCEGIVMLRVESPLYFPGANFVRQRVKKLCDAYARGYQQPVKVSNCSKEPLLVLQFPNSALCEGIVMLRVESPLYFPGANFVRQRVKKLCDAYARGYQQPVKVSNCSKEPLLVLQFPNSALCEGIVMLRVESPLYFPGANFVRQRVKKLCDAYARGYQQPVKVSNCSKEPLLVLQFPNSALCEGIVMLRVESPLYFPGANFVRQRVKKLCDAYARGYQQPVKVSNCSKEPLLVLQFPNSALCEGIVMLRVESPLYFPGANFVRQRVKKLCDAYARGYQQPVKVSNCSKEPLLVLQFPNSALCEGIVMLRVESPLYFPGANFVRQRVKKLCDAYARGYQQPVKVSNCSKEPLLVLQFPNSALCEGIVMLRVESPLYFPGANFVRQRVKKLCDAYARGYQQPVKVRNCSKEPLLVLQFPNSALCEGIVMLRVESPLYFPGANFVRQRVKKLCDAYARGYQQPVKVSNCSKEPLLVLQFPNSALCEGIVMLRVESPLYFPGANFVRQRVKKLCDAYARGYQQPVKVSNCSKEPLLVLQFPNSALCEGIVMLRVESPLYFPGANFVRQRVKKLCDAYARGYQQPVKVSNCSKEPLLVLQFPNSALCEGIVMLRVESPLYFPGANFVRKRVKKLCDAYARGYQQPVKVSNCSKEPLLVLQFPNSALCEGIVMLRVESPLYFPGANFVRQRVKKLCDAYARGYQQPVKVSNCSKEPLLVLQFPNSALCEGIVMLRVESPLYFPGANFVRQRVKKLCDAYARGYQQPVKVSNCSKEPLLVLQFPNSALCEGIVMLRVESPLYFPGANFVRQRVKKLCDAYARGYQQPVKVSNCSKEPLLVLQFPNSALCEGIVMLRVESPLYFPGANFVRQRVKKLCDAYARGYQQPVKVSNCSKEPLLVLQFPNSALCEGIVMLRVESPLYFPGANFVRQRVKKLCDAYARGYQQPVKVSNCSKEPLLVLQFPNSALCEGIVMLRVESPLYFPGANFVRQRVKKLCDAYARGYQQPVKVSNCSKEPLLVLQFPNSALCEGIVMLRVESPLYFPGANFVRQRVKKLCDAYARGYQQPVKVSNCSKEPLLVLQFPNSALCEGIVMLRVESPLYFPGANFVRQRVKKLCDAYARGYQQPVKVSNCSKEPLLVLQFPNSALCEGIVMLRVESPLYFPGANFVRQRVKKLCDAYARGYQQPVKVSNCSKEPLLVLQFPNSALCEGIVMLRVESPLYFPGANFVRQRVKKLCDAYARGYQQPVKVSNCSKEPLLVLQFPNSALCEGIVMLRVESPLYFPGANFVRQRVKKLCDAYARGYQQPVKVSNCSKEPLLVLQFPNSALCEGIVMLRVESPLYFPGANFVRQRVKKLCDAYARGYQQPVKVSNCSKEPLLVLQFPNSALCEGIVMLRVESPLYFPGANFVRQRVKKLCDAYARGYQQPVKVSNCSKEPLLVLQFPNSALCKGIVMLRVESPLYFPGANFVRQRVKKLCDAYARGYQQPVKVSNCSKEPLLVLQFPNSALCEGIVMLRVESPLYFPGANFVRQRVKKLCDAYARGYQQPVKVSNCSKEPLLVLQFPNSALCEGIVMLRVESPLYFPGANFVRQRVKKLCDAYARGYQQPVKVSNCSKEPLLVLQFPNSALCEGIVMLRVESPLYFPGANFVRQRVKKLCDAYARGYQQPVKVSNCSKEPLLVLQFPNSALCEGIVMLRVESPLYFPGANFVRQRVKKLCDAYARGYQQPVKVSNCSKEPLLVLQFPNSALCEGIVMLRVESPLYFPGANFVRQRVKKLCDAYARGYQQPVKVSNCSKEPLLVLQFPNSALCEGIVMLRVESPLYFPGANFVRQRVKKLCDAYARGYQQPVKVSNCSKEPLLVLQFPNSALCEGIVMLRVESPLYFPGANFVRQRVKKLCDAYARGYQQPVKVSNCSKEPLLVLQFPNSALCEGIVMLRVESPLYFPGANFVRQRVKKLCDAYARGYQQPVKVSNCSKEPLLVLQFPNSALCEGIVMLRVESPLYFPGANFVRQRVKKLCDAYARGYQQPVKVSNCSKEPLLVLQFPNSALCEGIVMLRVESPLYFPGANFVRQRVKKLCDAYARGYQQPVKVSNCSKEPLLVLQFPNSALCEGIVMLRVESPLYFPGANFVRQRVKKLCDAYARGYQQPVKVSNCSKEPLLVLQFPNSALCEGIVMLRVESPLYFPGANFVRQRVKKLCDAYARGYQQPVKVSNCSKEPLLVLQFPNSALCEGIVMLRVESPLYFPGANFVRQRVKKLCDAYARGYQQPVKVSNCSKEPLLVLQFPNSALCEGIVMLRVESPLYFPGANFVRQRVKKLCDAYARGYQQPVKVSNCSKEPLLVLQFPNSALCEGIVMLRVESPLYFPGANFVRQRVKKLCDAYARGYQQPVKVSNCSKEPLLVLQFPNSALCEGIVMLRVESPLYFPGANFVRQRVKKLCDAYARGYQQPVKVSNCSKEPLLVLQFPNSALCEGIVMLRVESPLYFPGANFVRQRVKKLCDAYARGYQQPVKVSNCSKEPLLVLQFPNSALCEGIVMLRVESPLYFPGANFVRQRVKKLCDAYARGYQQPVKVSNCSKEPLLVLQFPNSALCEGIVMLRVESPLYFPGANFVRQRVKKLCDAYARGYQQPVKVSNCSKEPLLVLQFPNSALCEGIVMLRVESPLYFPGANFVRQRVKKLCDAYARGYQQPVKVSNCSKEPLLVLQFPNSALCEGIVMLRVESPLYFPGANFVRQRVKKLCDAYARGYQQPVKVSNCSKEPLLVLQFPNSALCEGIVMLRVESPLYFPGANFVRQRVKKLCDAYARGYQQPVKVSNCSKEPLLVLQFPNSALCEGIVMLRVESPLYFPGANFVRQRVKKLCDAYARGYQQPVKVSNCSKEPLLVLQFPNSALCEGIVMLRVESPLYFPGANFVRQRVKKLCDAYARGYQQPVKVSNCSKEPLLVLQFPNSTLWEGIVMLRVESPLYFPGANFVRQRVKKLCDAYARGYQQPVKVSNCSKEPLLVLQFPNSTLCEGIVMLRVESPLYFPGANFVRQRVKKLCDAYARGYQQPVKIFVRQRVKKLCDAYARGYQQLVKHCVLDLSVMHDIDVTAIEAMRDLHRDLTQMGIQLCLASANRDVLRKMFDAQLLAEIGEQWLFVTPADAVKLCRAVALSQPAAKETEEMLNTPAAKETEELLNTVPSFDI